MTRTGSARIDTAGGLVARDVAARHGSVARALDAGLGHHSQVLEDHLMGCCCRIGELTGYISIILYSLPVWTLQSARLSEPYHILWAPYNPGSGAP